MDEHFGRSKNAQSQIDYINGNTFCRHIMTYAERVPSRRKKAKPPRRRTIAYALSNSEPSLIRKPWRNSAARSSSFVT